MVENVATANGTCVTVAPEAVLNLSGLVVTSRRRISYAYDLNMSPRLTSEVLKGVAGRHADSQTRAHDDRLGHAGIHQGIILAVMVIALDGCVTMAVNCKELPSEIM